MSVIARVPPEAISFVFDCFVTALWASGSFLRMTTFCNTVIIYDLKTVSKVGFVIASVAKQSKTKEIASGGTLAMTLILSFSAIYYLLHVIKLGVPKEWGLAMTIVD